MTNSDTQFPFVWMNGKVIDQSDATLHIASAAILYGLSVYTVFPICSTKDGLVGFRLSDHFDRLMESTRIVGIDSHTDSWSFDSFVNSTVDLMKSNKVHSDVFVRATIHAISKMPGTRTSGLESVLSMFVYSAKSILPESGARLKTTYWRRVPDISIPARAKVNGAYVNSALGKQDAIDSGYDDCVFLDSAGHVCELSAANIFIVRNGKLITPDSTSDLLEGINRKTIIEYARNIGLDVQERTVDLTELYIADEIFACGTSAYITPVIEVDARTIGNGKQGAITKKLAKIHIDTLHGKNKDYQKYLTLIASR
jgi:branched-chain amino acid aminotransferase